MAAVSDDLAWWRANGPSADSAVLREVLRRLQTWKDQHDQDRSRQPPPFMRMIWDGVFGDELEAVETAILEIEESLAAA